MKKCAYCAEEIQDEAIKCKHCGEAVKTQVETLKAPEPIKSVKKSNINWKKILIWTGIIILGLALWEFVLVASPFIALWYLWKKTKYSKNFKIIISVIIVFFSGMLAITVNSYSKQAKINKTLTIQIVDPQNNTTTTERNIDIKGSVNLEGAKIKVNNANVSMDDKNFTYTAELASDKNSFSVVAKKGNYTTSTQLTVNRILSAEEQAQLDKQRAEVEAKKIAEEKTKQKEAEAKRQAEIEASMPTDTQAQVIAKNFVEYHLNYPDNSEFPGMFDDGAFVVRTGSRYKVEHWVKASNAFGVVKKTYYTIILQYNGGDWANPYNWTEISFDFE